MKKIQRKNKKVIVFTILIVLSFIYLFYYIFFANMQVAALSKYGSRGNEVREIQTKLKRWGYYSGNIDGIYGNQTLAAVKYFQRKNGLVEDGIAGPKTLAAMGIFNTSNTNSVSSRK